MRKRFAQYWRLARLDRPIGWLLLLWPTLWAVWIAAAGRPRPFIVVIFVAGVVVMRAAGCVINDYLDRGFDPHVARTRGRPLAAGTVSLREALVLFLVLLTIAFILVLMLNRLALWLAVAGAGIPLTYPLFKRFTHLAQLNLGNAFS